MRMSLDDNIRDFDICHCGDYRRQHGSGKEENKGNGRGRCICVDCPTFRIHIKTIHVVAQDIAFEDMIEMPYRD